MPEQQDRERQDQYDDFSASTPKKMRQVVVKRLDSPPPSGKTAIHPRRPAPIVPTREERARKRQDDDANSEKFSHG
jgi:hypothetical protein